MRDFKEQSHAWCESYTFVTGKCQDFVVVHHSVEGLDPHGINVSIQKEPDIWARSRMITENNPKVQIYECTVIVNSLYQCLPNVSAIFLCLKV